MSSASLGSAAREGILILFAAYALFVFLVVAARDEAGDGGLLSRRTGLIRITTAALATLIAAGAVVRLNHVVNAPALTWSTDPGAYLIPGAVVFGGALYAAASAVGARRVAVDARRAGWIVMACALIVPSTFSLALPLLAPLVVTLGRAPSGSAQRRREPATRA